MDDSVEAAVRRDLEALKLEGGFQSSLAASALSLARTLDEGAGNITASVGRELRETLSTLKKEAEARRERDRFLDELNQPPLPPEVGNAKRPK